MTMTLQEPATGTMSDLVVHSSSWEAEAYQRAIALKNLHDGWDYRGGKPPTPEVINRALTYIGWAAELRLPALGAPFVAPLSEGGVQLEWDHGDRHVEVEITPDGVAKYTIVAGTDIILGDFGTWPKLELMALFGWLTAMP